MAHKKRAVHSSAKTRGSATKIGTGTAQYGTPKATHPRKRKRKHWNNFAKPHKAPIIIGVDLVHGDVRILTQAVQEMHCITIDTNLPLEKMLLEVTRNAVMAGMLRKLVSVIGEKIERSCSRTHS